MLTREITINNMTGIHARPAGQLVKLCKKFQSDVHIQKGDKQINPKSIFSILEGQLVRGARIEVHASGVDEAEALDSICQFILEITD